MNWVYGLLTIILGGGTIGAYLEYRSRNKKTPIDSATAAAAISEKAGNMALAIAEVQRRDIEALRTEMKVLAAEHAKRGEVLDRTRAEVRILIRGFREWYQGKIVGQWDEVRQQPVPPKPPTELDHWDSTYNTMFGD